MRIVTGVLIATAALWLPGPKLTIQVVELGWLPVPGIDLTIQRVESCSAKTLKTSGAPTRLNTNKAGTATLEVTGPADYQIVVPLQGGFKRTVKCIHLWEMKPEDTP